MDRVAVAEAAVAAAAVEVVVMARHPIPTRVPIEQPVVVKVGDDR